MADRTDITCNLPPCEDTSPLTGRKCGNKASVLISLFGEDRPVCSVCALRRYKREQQRAAE